MSAIPVLPQRRTPYGDLAPVLRAALVPLFARITLPASARILETGSSGGLLTALLAETRHAAHIAAADFVDPAPDTIESAVARAAHWSWSSQFVNSGLGQLAARPVYDLILAWALTPEHAVGMRAHQRHPGALIAVQLTPEDEPRLAYALHQHRQVHKEIYAVAGGRPAKSAVLWSSTA